MRTSYPPVTKLQLEVTLRQAAVMYTALAHLRNAEVFNANAAASTAEERKVADDNLLTIDQLMGMFQ